MKPVAINSVHSGAINDELFEQGMSITQNDFKVQEVEYAPIMRMKVLKEILDGGSDIFQKLVKFDLLKLK